MQNNSKSNAPVRFRGQIPETLNAKDRAFIASVLESFYREFGAISQTIQASCVECMNGDMPDMKFGIKLSSLLEMLRGKIAELGADAKAVRESAAPEKESKKKETGNA